MSDVSESTDLLYRIDSLARRPYGVGLLIMVYVSFILVFWDVYNIAYMLPSAAAEFGISSSSFLYVLPVTTGFAGYAIGELILGYYGGRIGRRIAILVALGIAAIGSILTAISENQIEFSIFRGVVGLAIGAEIGLASTYLSEITPSAQRGKVTAGMVIVGFATVLPVGVLGLYLVPRFPVYGWRALALLGLVVIVPAFFMSSKFMPESPRWLLKRGRRAEAESQIEKMENYVKAKYGKVERVKTKKVPDAVELQELSYTQLFRNRKFLGMIILMFVGWFFFYMPTYGVLTVFPSLFILHGFTVTNSFTYFLISSLGNPVGGILGFFLTDKVERKYLGAIIGVLLAISLVLWGFSVNPIDFVAAGFTTIFMLGFWFSIMYTYTAELFTTEARSTAFGFTDGLGHIGAAIIPYVLLPIALSAGVAGISGYTWAFIAPAIFALIAGFSVFTFGPKTKNRRLEEISMAEEVPTRNKTT